MRALAWKHGGGEIAKLKYRWVLCYYYPKKCAHTNNLNLD